MTERVIRVTIDPATSAGSAKVQSDLKRIEFHVDKTTLGFRTLTDVARQALGSVSGDIKSFVATLRQAFNSLNSVVKEVRSLGNIRNFAKVGVTVDVSSLKAARTELQGFQTELRKTQAAATAVAVSLRNVANSVRGISSGGGMATLQKDSAAASKTIADLNRQANSLKVSLSSIRMPNLNTGGGGAGGIGAGFKGLVGGAAFTTLARDTLNYAKAVAGLVDEYSKIQNQLRLVTTGSENLRAVQAELFTLAQDTRSPLEATSILYAKIARNSAELGLTQRQVLDITRTVNQAIQVSGGTAQEASAGVIQFSQALASGVLRGDELRSMMENMPRLSQALADGLGVSIGELRKMGEQGELTSERVIAALQKSAPAVAAEFAKLTPTIGGAFTVLRNSIVDTIGKVNEATGVGTAFAEAVISMAETISAFGRAISGTLQPTEELTSGFQLFTSAVLIAHGVIEPFVTALVGTFKTAFTSLGNLIGGFASAIVALFEGDYQRAWNIAKGTVQDFGTNVTTGLAETGQQIVSGMSNTIEKLVELWNKGAREAAPAQADLSGANLGKKKKEETFNDVANEIRRSPLYNANTGPMGMDTIDEFELAGITTDIQENALKGIEEAARESWNRIQYNMGQIKDKSSEFAKEAARNIQDAFADFLFDPFKEGLDGMLKGFVDTMRRITAEALAAKAMEALGGFLSKSGNPYLAAIGGIMGGRAEGGNVQKGVPYMVNEKAHQKNRPEIFVPNRAGHMVDQTSMSSGNGSGNAGASVVIVRDESELANAMLTHRPTQDAMIEYVSNHPGKFRRALGLNS